MTETAIRDFVVGVIRDEFAARGIEIHKIIFFGSRTRGDARPESDWDFIVVSKDTLERKKKTDIWLNINRKLVGQRIDADILIKSEPDFEKDKFDTGKVTYYAFKHGVSV
ncbi:MAG: nucleotidyltransferase domain-containing protein [Candidatus Latescibacter sp.]|nr:nucleotidyltransferase domain-containing protein [Candidatus Latescibacter sp.]